MAFSENCVRAIFIPLVPGYLASLSVRSDYALRVEDIYPGYLGVGIGCRRMDDDTFVDLGPSGQRSSFGKISAVGGRVERR